MNSYGIIFIITLFIISSYAKKICIEIPEFNCTIQPDYEKGCGNCNTTLDCGGFNHGICTDNFCECTVNYYGAHCGNERKYKLTAFILTFLIGPIFLLPPGAGRIYLGYIEIGIGQIFLGTCWLFFIIPLILNICISCFGCLLAWSSISVGNTDPHAAKYFKQWLSCGIIMCFGSGTISFILFAFISIAAIASIGWWFADWIMIILDALPDAKGHTLT